MVTTEEFEKKSKTKRDIESMARFANAQNPNTQDDMKAELEQAKAEYEKIEPVEYSRFPKKQRVMSPEYNLQPTRDEYLREELPEPTMDIYKDAKTKAELIDQGFAGRVAGKTYGAIGAGAGKIISGLEPQKAIKYGQKSVRERLPWTTDAEAHQKRRSDAIEQKRVHQLEEVRAGSAFWQEQGKGAKYSADTLNALQTARLTSIGAQTSLEKEQRRAAMLQDARQKLFSVPTAGVSIPSRGSYFDQLSIGFTPQQQYNQPVRNTGMENAMNSAVLYSMLGMGPAPQAQQNNTSALYGMLGLRSPAPARPAYVARPRTFKRPYDRPYRKPYTKPYSRPATPARRPFTRFKKSTTYSKFSKFKKPWQGKATYQKKPWQNKTTYKPAWKNKPKFGSWKKKTAWKGKTFKKKNWSNWKRR
jgi:hypothetical protein